MTYLDIYDISGSKDNYKKQFLVFAISVIVALFFIYLITSWISNDWSLKLIKSKKKCDKKDSVELKPEYEQVDKQVAEQVDEQVNEQVAEPVDEQVAEPELSNNAEPVAEPADEPVTEQFTNDLPYQKLNMKVSYNDGDNYDEVLQKLSLDDNILKSHTNYVNDRNKITSTASFTPARTDTQDIVTHWGLTRPKYIPLDPSARLVPGQDPEQGSKPVNLRWN